MSFCLADFSPQAPEALILFSTIPIASPFISILQQGMLSIMVTSWNSHRLPLTRQSKVGPSSLPWLSKPCLGAHSLRPKLPSRYLDTNNSNNKIPHPSRKEFCHLLINTNNHCVVFIFLLYSARSKLFTAPVRASTLQIFPQVTFGDAGKKETHHLFAETE